MLTVPPYSLLFSGQPSILARAVFYAKAKGSNGVLTDGRGVHAIQHGSAAGSDSNDPLWLPLGTNGQYCYLPGSSGNYASSPDSAALSVTGDLDLQVRCALDDWTPTSGQTLLAKTSGTTSYRFLVAATGVLQLFLSADGSTVLSTSSSAAPVVADGTTLWVRVTWRQSDKRVQFFTSSDGSAWTQLGTDQTLNVAAIFDNAAAVEIGSLAAGTASLAAGKFYRARIYSGFSDAGGTLAFDANFALATEPFATFTESSTNAATVTVNYSSSGRKSAFVPYDQYEEGVDDYFETPDASDLNFALTNPLTLCVLLRLQGTTANQVIASKKNDLTTGLGYGLDRGTSNAVRFICGDGTHGPSCTAPAVTQGVLTLVSGVRQVSQGKLQAFTDGVGGTQVTDTTTGTILNTGVFRVGALGNGAAGSFFDGVIVGWALFREELSGADQLRVKAALQ